VNGRVLRLIQESERVVAAGTPLLEIGDPDNLELVVDLLSVDAVKVIEGATASIDGWGGTPLLAKVIRVEPAGFTKVSALGIEEQRVRTILTLQNAPEFPDRLGHEFRVFAKITIHQSPDALCVPISALFRKGEKWAVYVIERGRARTVPVEIGQRNAGFAEVLKGLPEGTAVILHPSDRIVDGVSVVRSSAAQ
jgi:HlyD family secretion protein